MYTFIYIYKTSDAHLIHKCMTLFVYIYIHCASGSMPAVSAKSHAAADKGEVFTVNGVRMLQSVGPLTRD